MTGKLRRTLALVGLAVGVALLSVAAWITLSPYLLRHLSIDARAPVQIVWNVSTAIALALLFIFIAERKMRQAESSTHRREEHLAQVLKQTLHAIVGVDSNGKVVYWNRGAELLYGFLPSEILGESFERLVPERLRSQAESQGHLKGSEHIKEFLTERLTKDGEPVSVFVTQTALENEVRECAGCLALEQGQTDVRRLEHQIMHSEQLATVGEMAAGLAHEIKNPLAGIAGAIQVIGDTLPAEDERRTVVQQVLGQVKRIEGTLRDLLAYARPRKATLEPTDLRRLIDQSLRVVSLFPKQRVNIVRHYQENLPTAMVDAELFGQVLSNLIVNAVQAMPEGGTLTVSAFDNPDGVRISVKDTGQGIREGRRKRIFDPFYTTKNRGTGLGLPICRRVVEAHGGTISVESGWGHGAEFIVTLPQRSTVTETTVPGRVSAT